VNVRFLSRTVAGDYITSVGSVAVTMPESKLKRWTLIIGALVFAHLGGQVAAQETPQSGSAPASGEYELAFTGWPGPDVAVHLFAPDHLKADTPIVFVMHGWSREAKRYFNDWTALAEEQGFVVVVPHFPVKDFRASNDYNLGHVFDEDSGDVRPQDEWTFSVIELLFDDVVEWLDGRQTDYTLYGHSAGSQFVHRFLYYVPDARVNRFIAANAGWYTMPDFDTEYPYGLEDAAIDEDGLRAAFAKDMVLLLGREDTDFNDPDLRNTPEAKRQGKNRLARGLTMYNVAKTNAAKIGAEFNWRVMFVAGADHNNAKMVPTAASLIPKDVAPEEVLFVGNSFTYYNNSVHKHYRGLRNARADGGEASGDERMMAISGGSLAEHEDGLQKMLAEGNWDAVVLQGYSNGPITPGKAELFQAAARDYAKAIRNSGAEPLFFMTWAYTSRPQMTAELDAAYSAIGAELDAKVVPVGLAFERALSLRPELTLIIADDKHPTMAGTYLTACTFYSALHGESAEGLAYDAGLPADDAAFLQQVAWQVWLEYAAR
jgi:hypothetical protein